MSAAELRADALKSVAVYATEWSKHTVVVGYKNWTQRKNSKCASTCGIWFDIGPSRWGTRPCQINGLI